MRRLALMACGLVFAAGSTAPAFADDKADVLGELATQLKEMRGELNALRQENQRLQALVAQQHAPQAPQATETAVAAQPVDPRVMMPGGSETPASLFNDESQLRIYQRPGASPPSWLDLLIERNRQRTMEAWDRARAMERLSDERLAKIAAESRAIGTNYCPRPLREAVLAGGDVKASRDKLVAARSSDFDALFNRTEVKDYLTSKADRLKGGQEGWVVGNGQIAPANVRTLTDRLRRDLEDATILFGTPGPYGAAPGGLAMADELTRRSRDSSNPLVSGPTRDSLDLGRRWTIVEEAIANDMDVELVIRMRQIQEANRRIAGGHSSSPAHIAEDLAQVNDVLSGKISRTRVPDVQAFEGIEPGKH